jgi:hypothetical protein
VLKVFDAVPGLEPSLLQARATSPGSSLCFIASSRPWPRHPAAHRHLGVPRRS